MTRQALLCSLDKKELKAAIRSRYGTEDQCIKGFNHENQFAFVKNELACYFGDFPTLDNLNTAYTSTTAQQCIVFHLTDLSEFVGAKEKLNNFQMRQLADIIVMKYSFLRITELMLFCFNFKLGKYAEFYGTVDPLAIMKSLREFMRERNVAIYNYEQKVAALKAEQDKLNAITYKEYCEKRGIDPTKGLAQKVLPSPDDVGKGQVQEVFFSAKQKEDNVEEVLKSARGAIDNVFGLDKDGQEKMKYAFKLRYGMTPEEYIKKHET